VLHDLEALGVGLHQSVLDSVVDHLHEVPGPGRADVGVAGLRRQRREDRLERLHRLGVPADHQAEADLEPPDAAGDARVDEMDARVLGLDIPALRVAEVRVAAVDDDVALLADLQQVLEDRLGDLARGHHHPERPRRIELALQLLERGCGALLYPRVVRLDLVPGLPQPVRHPAAHPPEPDHSEVHQRSSSRMRATRRPRSFNDA
jgi:hypothetical protein